MQLPRDGGALPKKFIRRKTHMQKSLKNRNFCDKQGKLMQLRIARAEDAERACEVLRRSIKELCIADHGGDPQTIAAWLSNKTPENVRSWIVTPAQRLIVAEKGGEIVGVGSATAAGEITLNYVSPDARFQGVSKAILLALEGYLREQRQTRSTLSSTLTAHQFYRMAGYEDAGEPQAWGKLRGQPMAKPL